VACRAVAGAIFLTVGAAPGAGLSQLPGISGWSPGPV